MYHVRYEGLTTHWETSSQRTPRANIATSCRTCTVRTLTEGGGRLGCQVWVATFATIDGSGKYAPRPK